MTLSAEQLQVLREVAPALAERRDVVHAALVHLRDEPVAKVALAQLRAQHLVGSVKLGMGFLSIGNILSQP